MVYPLYTTPAIQYLETLVNPEWRVFEYGSGGSTEYYQRYCAEVRAIEHDSDYASRNPDVTTLVGRDSTPLPHAAPAEAEFFSRGFYLPRHPVLDRETEYHGMENWAWRAYASQLWLWPQGYFDLVVVDGMARSLCLYYAGQLTNPDGYIILDNSCRWQYNDLQGHLISTGWKRRDFWQPNHPGWCTSFFHRHYDSCDAAPRRTDHGDLHHAIGW